MEERKLGSLNVSAIGLGCMSMSQGYGVADRDESERALHRAPVSNTHLTLPTTPYV